MSPQQGPGSVLSPCTHALAFLLHSSGLETLQLAIALKDHNRAGESGARRQRRRGEL